MLGCRFRAPGECSSTSAAGCRRSLRETDPQAAQWDEPAVELDAILLDPLHELVEGAISRHINFREWDIEKMIEARSLEALHVLYDGLDGDGL